MLEAFRIGVMLNLESNAPDVLSGIGRDLLGVQQGAGAATAALGRFRAAWAGVAGVTPGPAALALLRSLETQRESLARQQVAWRGTAVAGGEVRVATDAIGGALPFAPDPQRTGRSIAGAGSAAPVAGAAMPDAPALLARMLRGLPDRAEPPPRPGLFDDMGPMMAAPRPWRGAGEGGAAEAKADSPAGGGMGDMITALREVVQATRLAQGRGQPETATPAGSLVDGIAGSRGDLRDGVRHEMPASWPLPRPLHVGEEFVARRPERGGALPRRGTGLPLVPPRPAMIGDGRVSAAAGVPRHEASIGTALAGMASALTRFGLRPGIGGGADAVPVAGVAAAGHPGGIDHLLPGVVAPAGLPFARPDAEALRWRGLAEPDGERARPREGEAGGRDQAASGAGSGRDLVLNVTLAVDGHELARTLARLGDGPLSGTGSFDGRRNMLTAA
ncbi:hypothetical protein [Rhodovastum atsumiense]|uniref:Uncharacterized protein n=1 Tax=Rhodovastum atsumiense TaxID=504468 RepID=A0A5M6J1G1_9PROT|nr:hypothetical protein [Rhodovastum atsumiense]KAA5613475.1 hypothetical protein F1189_05310 [Rhodovastum atsumiense]